MLGWGGRSWVGFVVSLVSSLGWNPFGKMPCDLRSPFLLQSLLHNIIVAFCSVLGKIYGLTLCNSATFSASFLLVTFRGYFRTSQLGDTAYLGPFTNAFRGD